MTDGRTEGPTDGRTDRRTDGRTDTPSYRDARTHLKIGGGRRRESGGRAGEKGRERIGSRYPHRPTASLTQTMWQPGIIFIPPQLPVTSAVACPTRFSVPSRQKSLRLSLVFLFKPSRSFHNFSRACSKLASFKARVGKSATFICPNCSGAEQTTAHLFSFPSHPMQLSRRSLIKSTPCGHFSFLHSCLL